MNDFVLTDHGDVWEREYDNLIRDKFPNYECFWQKFVVPLTNRQFRWHDIKICRGLNPLQEQLAMAHYSLFRHLVAAHRMQKEAKFDDETNIFAMDTIFFHLSAATEMVDRLLMIISTLKATIREPSQPVIPAKTEGEIMGHLREQHIDSYRGKYEKYLQTGQTVNYQIHSIHDFPERWLNGDEHLGIEWDKQYKVFIGLSNDIKSYRNVLTHNPILGCLLLEDDRLGIPKNNKLSKYKSLWSTAFYESDAKDYESVDVLMQKQTEKLEETLNMMWVGLIRLLDDLTRSSIYQGWLDKIEQPTYGKYDYPDTPLGSLNTKKSRDYSGSPKSSSNKYRANKVSDARD